MRILTPLLLLGAVVLGFFFFSTQEGADKSYSLFGIPLVPPIFAQGAGSTLPDPQAGLSSYIKLDPNLIDFDTIKAVFDETVQSGENYIIGAFNIPRVERNSAFSKPMHTRVYIDTNGFVIAYLTKDKFAADIFRWYTSDLLSATVQTVLGDALAKITTAIGGSAPTNASWYHWNYPSATHFSAATKKGAGDMYMRVPAEAVFSENPSYSWYGGFAYLSLDSFGNLRDESSSRDFTVDTLGLYITPGTRHRFTIGRGILDDNNFLGVAVVYQIP